MLLLAHRGFRTLLLLALCLLATASSAGAVTRNPELSMVARLERLLPERLREWFSIPDTDLVGRRPEVTRKCGAGIDPDGKPCPAPPPPCTTCG